MKLINRISPAIRLIILAALITLIFAVIISNIFELQRELDREFSSETAYMHVVNQVELGPRYPGSIGHEQVQDYIIQYMDDAGWTVVIQSGEMNGHEIRNIICTKGEGKSSILIGAHYDTRKFSTSEQDPELYKFPVTGANDGASGVAVMLELARLVPDDLSMQTTFVFFDQEDGGGIGSADWAMGSRYFVENLDNYPDSVVIIDMIGDADLNIFREINSSKMLVDGIWQKAHELGYDEFINEEKYSILDDHSPFIKKGVNAALIIDFSYPYWHTNEDTIDKISETSLKIVGDTILAWMNEELLDE